MQASKCAKMYARASICYDSATVHASQVSHLAKIERKQVSTQKGSELYYALRSARVSGASLAQPAKRSPTRSLRCSPITGGSMPASYMYSRADYEWVGGCGGEGWASERRFLFTRSIEREKRCGRTQIQIGTKGVYGMIDCQQRRVQMKRFWQRYRFLEYHNPCASSPHLQCAQQLAPAVLAFLPCSDLHLRSIAPHAPASGGAVQHLPAQRKCVCGNSGGSREMRRKGG